MRALETHLFPLTIDFNWLDAGNVVYHPNYLIFCERARHAAMEDAGFSWRTLWEEGYALALVETHSRYLRPATFAQSLHVLSSTKQVGGASLTVEQKLVRLQDPKPQGFIAGIPSDAVAETYYELTVKLVCVRMNPLKSAPLPDGFMRAFALRKGNA